MGLGGSDGFVTSTAAPIASGRSDRVGRAGLAPAGKILPCHGAHINSAYQTHKSECVQPHQISGCNENWPRLTEATLRRLS